MGRYYGLNYKNSKTTCAKHQAMIVEIKNKTDAEKISAIKKLLKSPRRHEENTWLGLRAEDHETWINWESGASFSMKVGVEGLLLTAHVHAVVFNANSSDISVHCTSNLCDSVSRVFASPGPNEQSAECIRTVSRSSLTLKFCIAGSSCWRLINWLRSTPVPRYPQRSIYRLTQALNSGCRYTHQHRHVRIPRASRSLHVPNDDITDGIRDAQRLHFSTKLRGVGGILDSEPVYGSGETPLSRVPAPPPAPWPDGGPESLGFTLL
ncbi:hypothetical protein PoB_003746100 [Plakobranchus ocellatus]|uniref:C-type lectin domain-containing protein n=1 Tax=Plakobranchus ocellatus TaxID=259542 RepID=A0AAV4AS18_9GAST|nr:hypothetical protein PoB_003746100 [Plakobranchus ocellatus]